MTDQPAKPRKVRCPTCGADVVWGPDSPYRPFCSERCRLIDLGAAARLSQMGYTDIAVMKGGVVQQLGTPDDIYNRPANTYVATFIGSPTMNLLRGAATGGQFGIQGAALNLAAPASANEVLLGVRPEHLVMQDSAPWRGKVSVVEPTGPDTYVVVDTAAGSVTLRTDAQTRVQPGDSVGLAVEPANAHWFDASSENRLA